MAAAGAHRAVGVPGNVSRLRDPQDARLTLSLAQQIGCKPLGAGWMDTPKSGIATTSKYRLCGAMVNFSVAPDPGVHTGLFATTVPAGTQHHVTEPLAGRRGGAAGPE